MFESVWMGVTGGAMVGATSRGDKNTCKFDDNEQRQDLIRSVLVGSYLKAPLN